FGGYGLEVLQVLRQNRAGGFERRARVPVGAALRFGDDFVNDAERFEFGGGQFQSGGGFGSAGGVTEQDRGAAFGGDHGVPGVFTHQDPVAHPDRERPAGPTFPDNDADHRDLQRRHLKKVQRDRPGLAALFSS